MKMKILDSRKKLIIAVVALVSVLGAGAALAYWTAGGGGSGQAGTGTSDAVVITQTSVVTAMGPGVAPQDLAGTFTATEPTYVGQVTAVVDSTSNAGCTAADFVITQPAPTNAEVTTGSTWSGGSIAFLNSATVNQDACQGVTVDIDYTSN